MAIEMESIKAKDVNYRPLARLGPLAWVGSSWGVVHRGGQLDNVGGKIFQKKTICRSPEPLLEESSGRW